MTANHVATLETLNAVHSAGREYSAQGHSAQKRASMNVVEAEGAVGEFVHRKQGRRHCPLRPGEQP